VFNAIKRMIAIRAKQKAFQPNTTQFTLHLGAQVFGFWRQSVDRIQNIFCLNNISAEPVTLSLSDLNLISTQDWSDLLSGASYDDLQGSIELAPYQSVWLSNR